MAAAVLIYNSLKSSGVFGWPINSALESGTLDGHLGLGLGQDDYSVPELWSAEDSSSAQDVGSILMESGWRSLLLQEGRKVFTSQDTSTLWTLKTEGGERWGSPYTQFYHWRGHHFFGVPLGVERDEQDPGELRVKLLGWIDCGDNIRDEHIPFANPFPSGQVVTLVDSVSEFRRFNWSRSTDREIASSVLSTVYECVGEE